MRIDSICPSRHHLSRGSLMHSMPYHREPLSKGEETRLHRVPVKPDSHRDLAPQGCLCRPCSYQMAVRTVTNPLPYLGGCPPGRNRLVFRRLRGLSRDLPGGGYRGQTPCRERWRNPRFSAHFPHPTTAPASGSEPPPNDEQQPPR